MNSRDEVVAAVAGERADPVQTAVQNDGIDPYVFAFLPLSRAQIESLLRGYPLAIGVPSNDDLPGIRLVMAQKGTY